MKLPSADSAVVPRSKIVDYLLIPAHPDNGGKARFLMEAGFDRENWVNLADAFRKHALRTPVARCLESTHGRKYVLDGPIETPGDRKPDIRVIWIVDTGSQSPRLVTAYPYKQKDES